MGVAVAAWASSRLRVQPVPLRRNRDFQLLWGGQAVSLLGSQTSKIAYPLLVLAMTGSPAKAGIAGFAAMLGYLLFPLPAGGLADRHDRKRIMIALRRDPARRGGQHRRGRLGGAHHVRAGAGGGVRRGRGDRVLRPGPARGAADARAPVPAVGGRLAERGAAECGATGRPGAGRRAVRAVLGRAVRRGRVVLPGLAGHAAVHQGADAGARRRPLASSPARRASRRPARGGCGPNSARGWPGPGGSRSCATARSSPPR